MTMTDNPGKRRGRRHTDGQSSEHRDRWLISYSDLVTLLFALFVILYAAADKTRAPLIAQAVALQLGDAQDVSTADSSGEGVLPEHDALVGTRRAIEKVFADNRSLGTRARLQTDERGIVISLAEAGFFAPGDATVRQDAAELIELLSATLRETTLPIRIEGHTDSIPISNARYPSNWELSAARASTVLARLVECGITPSRLSVAGYAGERPVASNSTQEGRALNRRVDIVILRSER
jgi:chemotaxis protein MotB